MRIFARSTARVAGIVLLEVEVVPMRQSTMRSQKPGVSFETVEHAAPQLRLTQDPHSDPETGEQSGGFRIDVGGRALGFAAALPCGPNQRD